MHKPLIGLIAALLASPALSDTLVEHANGIQADAAGRLQHFTGLLIGSDGKVVRVLRPADACRKPLRRSMRTARRCCPG